MSANFDSIRFHDQRKRIFVTQLREDEEEVEEETSHGEESNNVIQRFPVVREKAGQLIETGFRTHQKTLLLKRQNELHRVDAEFNQTRSEFKAKMDKYRKQEEHLIRERRKLTERVNNFEKFIDENNAKKTRAVLKYEKESKLKNQKEDELRSMKMNVEKLQNRLSTLKRKIAKYQIYEQFLMSAVDELPEDYLESSDNMVSSLMQRYQTLIEMNESIQEHREVLNEKVKECQQILQDSSYDAAQNLLLHNKELAECRERFEILHNENTEKETNNIQKKQKLISSSEELGEILLAIENLSSFCGSKNVEEKFSTPELKLKLISTYLQDREDVYQMTCQLIQQSLPQQPTQNSSKPSTQSSTRSSRSR
ncbi:coiled-coil domain-containing protein 42-like isoform X1 [Clytia hemisphaerica]|uniref:DUF4200 domain-containing protein n=1 Tax=Clytia hemisphaerica TaxID=252671 RepID=A0A7M5V8N8_9CNID